MNPLLRTDADTRSPSLVCSCPFNLFYYLDLIITLFLTVNFQEQMEENKSDITQVSNTNDGKFSLLQFALYNFRDAVNKYVYMSNITKETRDPVWWLKKRLRKMAHI